MIAVGPLDQDVAVWCFEGTKLWAVTDDEAGARLPDDLGPWILRKRLTMDGSHLDEAEALRLILDHGFCCFDPSPAPEEA